MLTFWNDLRYALRQLRRSPAFAAILTLALGIGSSTAMLAVVDSVLLQPVALPDAEQLVSLGRMVDGQRADNFSFKDLDALGTRQTMRTGRWRWPATGSGGRACMRTRT